MRIFIIQVSTFLSNNLKKYSDGDVQLDANFTKIMTDFQCNLISEEVFASKLKEIIPKGEDPKTWWQRYCAFSSEELASLREFIESVTKKKRIVYLVGYIDKWQAEQLKDLPATLFLSCEQGTTNDLLHTKLFNDIKKHHGNKIEKDIYYSSHYSFPSKLGRVGLGVFENKNTLKSIIQTRMKQEIEIITRIPNCTKIPVSMKKLSDLQLLNIIDYDEEKLERKEKLIFSTAGHKRKTDDSALIKDISSKRKKKVG